MNPFQITLFKSEPSMARLFRFLDDFDSYAASTIPSQAGPGRTRRGLAEFQPKFDVREVADAYELHGELPGLSKEDVHIEFTDGQTLQVRGRVERSYTEGRPPAGLVEGTKMSGAIEEANGGDKHGEKKKKEEEEEAAPEDKYWVSERSIGEFSRTFSFPLAVDQEGVKATLEDGILNIHVPKVKKTQGRRIMVN